MPLFSHVIDIRLIGIHVMSDRLDGLRQSLLKGILRLPVRQAHDLLVAAQKAVDLALFRAEPLLIADDLRGRIDLADQGL